LLVIWHSTLLESLDDAIKMDLARGGHNTGKMNNSDANISASFSTLFTGSTTDPLNTAQEATGRLLMATNCKEFWTT
jgi:hypothetical protein